MCETLNMQVILHSILRTLRIAIIMMIIIIVTVTATTIKKDVFTAHTKYTLVRDMEIENHFKYYN